MNNENTSFSHLTPAQAAELRNKHNLTDAEKAELNRENVNTNVNGQNPNPAADPVFAPGENNAVVFTEKSVFNKETEVKTANSKAPSVSSVSVKSSDTDATISWCTSGEAVSAVYYNTAPVVITLGVPKPMVVPNDSRVLENNKSFVTAHSARLTGLNANTKYHYVLVVKDNAGNENVTPDTTFKTTK